MGYGVWCVVCGGGVGGGGEGGHRTPYSLRECFVADILTLRCN